MLSRQQGELELFDAIIIADKMLFECVEGRRKRRMTHNGQQPSASLQHCTTKTPHQENLQRVFAILSSVSFLVWKRKRIIFIATSVRRKSLP